MTRFIVWHIPVPGAPLPRFYIDADSEAVALRIYTETPPNGGELLVDVFDDGVSIMKSNNQQKTTIKNEQAYIEFGTPVGTFTAAETITGTTSGATAKVAENKSGRLTLIMDSPSATAFTVGEAITGTTSAATGVVNAYVRQTRSAARTTVNGQAYAHVDKGQNSNADAQDFKDVVKVDEGSWLSCSVIDYVGASNITVQLELRTLSESVETRKWV